MFVEHQAPFKLRNCLCLLTKAFSATQPGKSLDLVLMLSTSHHHHVVEVAKQSIPTRQRILALYTVINLITPRHEGPHTFSCAPITFGRVAHNPLLYGDRWLAACYEVTFSTGITIHMTVSYLHDGKLSFWIPRVFTPVLPVPDRLICDFCTPYPTHHVLRVLKKWQALAR